MIDEATLRDAPLHVLGRLPDSSNNALLCSGRVSVVCLDATRLRPRPLPQYLLKEIDDGL